VIAQSDNKIPHLLHFIAFPSRFISRAGFRAPSALDYTTIFRFSTQRFGDRETIWHDRD